MHLKEIDQAFVLHTYARNYVNFVKGENAKLYDERGKEFIDFTSGIGVVSVGHGNKQLADAICDQAQKIIHISNLYLIEPQALLAKRIVELSGYDMRLFFANSGAEANEGAIKIARKYGEVDGQVKRYKIITLKHSFHGRTITALKATGQEAMHTYFGPFPDGFVYADSIEQIPDLIDDHTVAVMIELIQGEGGVEPQDKTAVQNLAKLLKQKDVLLIIDEVQTGVYRTGEFLASNLYEIEPDIITLAKGLGGGVPIGAVMTRLKDIFKPGDHGSTFGGNYLSTRAALEVIAILEELKASGKLDEHFIYFEERLKEIAKKYAALFEKEVGFGMMRGLRAKSAEIQGKIIEEAFSEGILVLKAGRNTVRFLPPLTITKEEMDEGFRRLEKALERVAVA
ncbi:acetylornithine/N-succinyldiaminopimelate aminotransferase [Nitratiruptor sp. YY08-26]|uniref:aspartate aminotransferase family protein n=1 Tax=unclassified Nitratiruptor TaxID=2624044 RepID=UPI00191580BB|nr:MULTISPECIES: aspartate aminotransferase family protein [unclassified Nitratiruptor]BCD62438.1 acetylornithine/N-succinyldiaminopimelate aminotransferase [Nitratiruptor sp. YY08-13]BCD66374.1 acetylornithine/N-succinyldiaminopimelate aminotransferase [Nitratiruptor sp. YY08-26]